MSESEKSLIRLLFYNLSREGRRNLQHDLDQLRPTDPGMILSLIEAFKPDPIPWMR